MSRRPSDAWIGAAVLLACLALLSYFFHPFIATQIVVELTLMGMYGLVVLHLWLQPQHGLQRLACALLTLPVLMHHGVVSAVALFLTMWNTHVGHDFTIPPKPSPPSTDSGA